MFTVSARIYPLSEIDMPRYDRPLMVGSCGHFILSEKERKEISRPGGRRDYQILYIRSGKGYFTLKEQELEVKAGHAVFYFPHEDQFYHYCGEDNPDVYWLHFTGSHTLPSLGELGLLSQRVYNVKVKDRYSRILDHIIQELELKRRNYNMVADAQFQEMLCYMSREILAQKGIFVPRTKEVEQALQHFHTQFSKPFNLAQYAHSFNMSPCWFTRKFHRQIGISPQQYLTDVRITHACELLASGSSVAEAGETVGYEDALYFSRVFKKHTGQSPTQYRKSAGGLLMM